MSEFSVILCIMLAICVGFSGYLFFITDRDIKKAEALGRKIMEDLEKEKQK